jgi:hypothetical protein
VYGESAIIGDARENRLSIYADHIGLTKFSTRDDGEYKKFTHTVEMLLEELLKHETVLSRLAKPMPASGRLFTGRQSYLDTLEAFFVPRPTGPKSRRMFLLYGMGGIGKTQICVRFTEKYSHLCVVIILAMFC